MILLVLVQVKVTCLRNENKISYAVHVYKFVCYFYNTFNRKINLSTLYGLGHGDIKPMKGQNANGICSKI